MPEYPNLVTQVWKDCEERRGEPCDYRWVLNTLLAYKYFPAAEWLLAQGEDWKPQR